MKALKSSIYRVLRFAERFTRTDMVYLASGGFWLMLGPAISAVLAFLLSVAFANLLPETEYGIYRYVLAGASVLGIATLAGMNTAITRAVARGRLGVVLPALARRIEWGFLGGLASLNVAAYYHFSGDAQLALLFFVIAPFIPFAESLSLHQAVLSGLRDFRRASLLLMATQVIATGSVIATVLFSGNIVLIVIVSFAVWTITRGVAFFLVYRDLAKQNELERDADPETLRYGYHLSLMGALDTIAAQADKMIIFHFLGAAALAGYAIALAIPDQVKGLLKNALMVSFPPFSLQNADDVRRTIGRASWFLFIPLALSVVAYVLIAPVLFSWLFPKYTEFILYSQVYALVILLVPKALHRIFFESHGKTRELYGFQAFAFLLKIGLLLALVPHWGVWGALVALLLTELGVYIYLEIRVRS